MNPLAPDNLAMKLCHQQVASGRSHHSVQDKDPTCLLDGPGPVLDE